jgi:hypothetical protein
MNATYANAEVRGRLRQWKAKLATDYRRLDRLLTSDALTADAADFCARSSATGRSRAFARIAKRLAPPAPRWRASVCSGGTLSPFGRS